MLDFISFTHKNKDGMIKVTPSFQVIKSKDLMIRGNSFYAIWDENRDKWSTDPFDAIRIIDQCTIKYTEEHFGENSIPPAVPQLLRDSSTGVIDQWHKYCKNQTIDNYTILDETLIFSNMDAKRENYSSKHLDYPLEPGDYSAWDKLIGTLYTEKERHKIEWSIGSIVSGDSKKLQKFLVFYGAAGAGKSTIMNVVQELFKGYYAVFDAKALGSNNNAFALEAFNCNPLVAIQHDGDLSKIEDNTKLNSLVSHEEMVINEKYKSAYTNRYKAFLMMGTNRPVKITDAKSGLLRRLIDVTPSGNKLPFSEYTSLMNKINFQLSGIAYHCLEVYKDDPNYYDDYVPIDMLGASNDFYNFISDNYITFSDEKDMTLSLAWEIYKNYVEDSNMPYPLSKRAFKEELKNYFLEFRERYTTPEGKRIRNYYIQFLDDKFNGEAEPEKEIKTKPMLLDLEDSKSLLDDICADYPAQYTKDDGTPLYAWKYVNTTLKDLDTSKLHYVKIPENHIVIDFDIPDEKGNKSLERNLEAASKWPKTYAELSKSGCGVHLHYIYSGDATKLSRVYDEHIEIKVYVGNSSLRRKLTKCNHEPIATISSGLPLKEESKKMVGENIIKNEKMLRVMILRNLNKEYHDATKPSIDFIDKLLKDAYNSGMKYDVTNLRPSILNFAMNSTNQADYCVKCVNQMKFKSDEPSEHVEAKNSDIVFYDIEVFPNLFLVNWKFRGKDKKVVRMINPSASDIENLIKFNLVGFNNRRYDNHILYARMLGYDNEQLFDLSQRIINGSPNAMFAEAYNLSYTDVYDFSSAVNKKSLKKWEIELGIKHHELGLPWDQPVPKELWTKVAEYCDDDVIATEAVFDHLISDWDTRKILADIADKTVNDSTNALTTAIVFQGNKNPQNEFNYRDMSKPVKLKDFDDDEINHYPCLDEREYEFIDEETYEFIAECTPMSMQFTAWDGSESILPYFPGYEFKNGKSTYRGLEVGEGGYVEAIWGVHENVALLDVASMHPHSVISECLFGPYYTGRFRDIVRGRICIKHEDFDLVRQILDGKFAPYLVRDEVKLAALSTALKTPINSCYGLTSASFDNPFRDKRNKDNIVAKRGALFMIDLKYEVEARGFKVAHIKTDSIKIPNATPEIIQFVIDFGKKYGYEFEHEATYKKMCLVNNAVYIAKYADTEWCQQQYGYVPGDNRKHPNAWTATGTQFQIPYVFKTLFSGEEVEFEDLCETKSVKTAMHLDFNENDETQHNLKFIGKVGSFCPIKPGCGGGLLVREGAAKDGSIKYDAVTGTKGYRWMEADMVKDLGYEERIDMSYYKRLADEAKEAINKYIDFEYFADRTPF